MTRTFAAIAALLFATHARAAEPEVAPAPAPDPPAEAQVASPPEPTPASAPAEPPRSEPIAATVAAPSEPAPEIGWGSGRRAPMYVNLMLFAGALAEDGDNRLTLRDSELLEGAGGLFRLGAVIDRHHRLGGRLQSFVRPTRKVALDPSSTAPAGNQWGAVTFFYVGPEYLYTSDLGVYGGASLGIGCAMSARDVEDDDASNDDGLEKASGGLAGMLSVGYEWRANKWLALNIEAFGGLYHGVDDNENGINGGIFGLGMGAGF
ncbi:MAG: hypothetical protein JXP73_03845 [Deltaproteobacteria bacterium]|nr:hypothetical protein [Deltaproteobacteria bacterium]